MFFTGIFPIIRDFRAEKESRKNFPGCTSRGSDGLFLYAGKGNSRPSSNTRADRGHPPWFPEFDMARPQHRVVRRLSGTCQREAARYGIERKWGVFDPAMDPTDEKTYKFLNEFIGENGPAFFPTSFFHIGGDEVNGKEWDANPKIQAFHENRTTSRTI